MMNTDEYARFYPRLAQLWRILVPNPKQGRKHMSNTTTTRQSDKEFNEQFYHIIHPVELDILYEMFHKGEQTRDQLIKLPVMPGALFLML